MNKNIFKILPKYDWSVMSHKTFPKSRCHSSEQLAESCTGVSTLHRCQAHSLVGVVLKVLELQGKELCIGVSILQRWQNSAYVRILHMWQAYSLGVIVLKCTSLQEIILSTVFYRRSCRVL